MPVPGIPANFYLQQGNGQAFLSWDLTDTATGYSVERSTDGITFAVISTPTTNLYLDTTVVVGTLYYFKVAATNGSGTGTYTAAQNVVPTYSGNMTLGQVRVLAQQTADQENSNFVTLPEWNTYINQSYFELYDILVQKYGDEYFLATPWQFQTTGPQFYNLPDGSSTYVTTIGGSTTAKPFYKLKGVDLAINSAQNSWISLRRFNFIARNRYIYPNSPSPVGTFNPQYRLMGNQIEFIPPPAAGQIIQVWYVPRMTQLLRDTDMLDGISGWTEYVVVDAAIKASSKQEDSNVGPLMQRKMMLMQRIEEAAGNRDAGIPDTISDTRRNTDPYGLGSPNGDGPSGGFVLAPLGLIPGLMADNEGYSSLANSVHFGQFLLTVFACFILFADFLYRRPIQLGGRIGFARVAKQFVGCLSSFGNHISKVIHRGANK